MLSHTFFKKSFRNTIDVSNDLDPNFKLRKVLEGKFGHTFANSGKPDETSHLDFHCLLSLFFIPIIEI